MSGFWSCLVLDVRGNKGTFTERRLITMLRFGCSCLILFGLSQGYAHAQEIDCDLLRTTNIPYEIKADMDLQFPPGLGRSHIARPEIMQVYRSDTGGPKITYQRQDDGAVVKITAYGLLRVETARLSGPVARYEYPGFDVTKMRAGSDYTFKQIRTSKTEQGQELTEVFLISLKVVKKSVVEISNCSFAAIEYHVETIDAQTSNHLSASDIQYMPELQEIYSSKADNAAMGILTTITAKDIHTRFERLQLR